jgi:hypothetical protein
MKRRGFIGVLAMGLLVLLRGLAQAICNPSLVQLLGQGRQLIQARFGRGPSLELFHPVVWSLSSRSIP